MGAGAVQVAIVLSSDKKKTVRMRREGWVVMEELPEGKGRMI
jgi:hypothetical protein